MVIFLYQLGNQIPEANAYKLVLVFYSSKGPSVNVNLEFYLWGSLVPPCLIFHVIKLPNHYGLKTANATCAGASSGEFFFSSCHSHFFALEIVRNIASPNTFARTCSTLTAAGILLLEYSHSLQMQPLCNCTYRWEWHVCLFSLLLHLQ